MLSHLLKKILFWKSNVEKHPDFNLIDAYKKHALVIVIAQDLENQSKINSKKLAKHKVVPITLFDAVGMIQISLEEYLARICLYVEALPSELITMMIYLRQHFQRNKNSMITESNVHQFVLVSFLLAHKTIRIKPYNDADFAEIGGINHRELQALKQKFLQDNDFHFVIKYRDYRMYENLFDKLSDDYITSHPDLLETNSLIKKSIQR